MPVIGDEQILSRLDKELQGLSTTRLDTFMNALVRQIEARALQYAPDKTSQLINSSYKFTAITPTQVRGAVGFGAPYAIYVHQAPGKLLGTRTPRWPRRFGFVWDPNGRPKFLKIAADETIREDFKPLAREYLRT